MAAEPISLERLNWHIGRNPFNRWLGLRAVSWGDGTVELTSAWREEFGSNPEIGYTHGGVLAGLAAMGGALALATRVGHPLTNVNLQIDYHRPALPGDLLVHAAVVRLGRQFATADAEIRDLNGTLLCSARGTYLAKRGEQ